MGSRGNNVRGGGLQALLTWTTARPPLLQKLCPIPLEMAAYETYETDATYDDMDGNPTAERAPEAVPQPVKIEIKSGNQKFKFALLAILLLILLAIGGVIGILLMSKFEELRRTSCYLPPDRCGIGRTNRTRDKLADAQNKGEKCAKSRIIELAETISCNVDCTTPVDCKVGTWGS